VHHVMTVNRDPSDIRVARIPPVLAKPSSLPHPDGPSNATNSPGRDVEREIPSSALARAELSGEVLEDDRRTGLT